MINYVTDGGPSHFKNRQNILNLTFHDIDFGVPAVWSFSATSHGKGPVDGLGAALKSTATRYLLRHGPNEAFKCVRDFYEFSKQRQNSTGNPIELLYAKSDEILTLHRAKNTQRWSNINGRLHEQHNCVPIVLSFFLTAIHGIRSFHHFMPSGFRRIQCRRTWESTGCQNYDLWSAFNAMLVEGVCTSCFFSHKFAPSKYFSWIRTGQRWVYSQHEHLEVFSIDHA